MSIVVDSNIIAAVFVDTPYSEMAESHVVAWLEAEISLLAPTLFEYEISTILRRCVQAGMLSDDESRNTLNDILDSNVKIIPPTVSLHRSALQWAGKIMQSKAYDAHYLALAEQEDAQFWSADKRLVNSVKPLGIDWVHWIGES